MTVEEKAKVFSKIMCLFSLGVLLSRAGEAACRAENKEQVLFNFEATINVYSEIESIMIKHQKAIEFPIPLERIKAEKLNVINQLEEFKKKAQLN